MVEGTPRLILRQVNTTAPVLCQTLDFGCHTHACVGMLIEMSGMPTQAWAWHPTRLFRRDKAPGSTDSATQPVLKKWATATRAGCLGHASSHGVVDHGADARLHQDDTARPPRRLSRFSRSKNETVPFRDRQVILLRALSSSARFRKPSSGRRWAKPRNSGTSGELFFAGGYLSH